MTVRRFLPLLLLLACAAAGAADHARPGRTTIAGDAPAPDRPPLPGPARRSPPALTRWQVTAGYISRQYKCRMLLLHTQLLAPTHSCSACHTAKSGESTATPESPVRPTYAGSALVQP